MEDETEGCDDQQVETRPGEEFQLLRFCSASPRWTFVKIFSKYSFSHKIYIKSMSSVWFQIYVKILSQDAHQNEAWSKICALGYFEYTECFLYLFHCKICNYKAVSDSDLNHHVSTTH